MFEIRFGSHISVVDVLPGVLFRELSGEKRIKHLPISELPHQIRSNDPNLKYAPLVKVEWNKFAISIGEKSIIINCNLPYAGWNRFKEVIKQIITITKELDIIEDINRYSIKYIDLIPETLYKDKRIPVNLSMTMAETNISKRPFHSKIRNFRK